jgi:acylphosphatase
MQQAHLFIIGRVQGVGYRQFVKSKARKLGLTGWVANIPDGSVEAVVQGEKQRIEMLIQDCQRGPYLAEVRDIQVRWEEAGTLFDDFTIHKLS